MTWYVRGCSGVEAVAPNGSSSVQSGLLQGASGLINVLLSPAAPTGIKAAPTGAGSQCRNMHAELCGIGVQRDVNAWEI